MKDDNKNIPEWKIPITWSVCGYVYIEAKTLAEAMEIARDDDNEIPLPTDSDYIDGSWELSFTEEDDVRKLYNDNQQDMKD